MVEDCVCFELARPNSPADQPRFMQSALLCCTMSCSLHASSTRPFFFLSALGEDCLVFCLGLVSAPGPTPNWEFLIVSQLLTSQIDWAVQQRSECRSFAWRYLSSCVLRQTLGPGAPLSSALGQMRKDRGRNRVRPLAGEAGYPPAR